MIPELLYSRLGPLVGNRAWPNQFAQPVDAQAPVWPAIRWTIVTTDPLASLCGSNDEQTDQVDVQIDVVADDYDAMRTLKRQVISALIDTDPPCTRRPGGRETVDMETRTQRAILLYRFHPSSLPESPA